MLPEIHLGPLTLQTFGICFGLGFVAAGLVGARRLGELGLPKDWAYEITFAGLVGGLVGARLNYIFQNWSKVSNDLLGNLFSGSGLVWYGGVIGGGGRGGGLGGGPGRGGGPPPRLCPRGLPPRAPARPGRRAGGG